MDEDAYMSLASAHVALVEEHQELTAERDRLRVVVDAVRVMWDDIMQVDMEGTLVGFPVADYNALEEALDRLADATPAACGKPVHDGTTWTTVEGVAYPDDGTDRYNDEASPE